MRRALLTEWPALSFLYGLRPWHVSLLTEDEINEYAAQAETFLKAVVHGR